MERGYLTDKEMKLKLEDRERQEMAVMINRAQVLDVGVQHSHKTLDVAGLGWVMVDFLVVLPSYPEVDTKVTILAGCKQVGGPVARAMMTLSRLGKQTALIAKIGDDCLGRFVQEALRKEGVELGAVEIEERGKTRFSHIWVDRRNGSRTVAYSKGHLKEIQLGPESKERIKRSRFLHLDGRELEAALIAAQLAREGGGRVMLDAGSVKPGINKLIPLVDVIVASSDFIREFSPYSSLEETGKKLLAMGPRVVVLTLGKDGVICISKESFFYQPVFPVKAVDTNGAGDVFNGGLLFGLLENWDLPTSVRFASAVAAIKCKRLGNKGLPVLSEVQRFLQLHSSHTV